MLAKTLTGSQREALGHLLSAVELHETELRGSLPRAPGMLTKVEQPLAGALRDILAALGQCKKAGV